VATSGLLGDRGVTLLPVWLTSACLVPAGPPGIHERSIFVVGVSQAKCGVDQVKFAVRQSFVEILGVGRRERHVSAAGNDLHRRL